MSDKSRIIVLHPQKGINIKNQMLIDKKVRKEVVELDGIDKMLGVIEKVKFTEVKTGNYFFVYHYLKEIVTSEIYPA